MVDLERIVPLSPEGTSTPLFCVHAGSGSGYAYLPLAGLLGADRPVYGVEAPGFDGGREPVRSLPALSAEYAGTLRAFHPEGRLALLGWSLGGIIAFDLARRLTEAGARVDRVVMIDVSRPAVEDLPPERELTRRFLRDMLATVGAPRAALGPIFAGLPDEVTSATVFAAAETSGVLPDGLDAELLAERYAIFHALVEASFGFEVTEPYHGPVTHLIASESMHEAMSWSKWATDLTEHIVPGDHHSIWTGPGLPRLAELARSALTGTG